jgi:hypothetical protein
MWMGPQVGKRWSRSDPLSLVCSNQGGGRGSSRQNFIESKKEAPVVVCVLDFCSDDGGRATTRPEYKKRETQLCDGFAVCGRSYFRRSAFSRVHLFFLLPWEGPQVIGWIPLLVHDPMLFTLLYNTHKAYRNIYIKREARKCRQRWASAAVVWVEKGNGFSALLYTSDSGQCPKVSPGRLFSYIPARLSLSLSY